MESIKELKKICQDPVDYENPNSFLYNKMWRAVSIYITKLLLYTPVKPDHVTMVMVFWGFIVGFLFSIGTYWYMIVGVLVLEFLWVIDCIDGEIARYKKIFSLNGIFLDLMAHLTNISVPLIGITIGLYRHNPNFSIVLAGLSASVFSVLYLVVQPVKHHLIFRELIRAANKAKRIKSKKTPKKMISTQTQKNILKLIAKKVDSFYDHIYIIQVILLGAVFSKLDWVLYFYGLTFPLMWLVKFIYEYRVGSKPYEYLFEPYKR